MAKPNLIPDHQDLHVWDNFRRIVEFLDALPSSSDSATDSETAASATSSFGDDSYARCFLLMGA